MSVQWSCIESFQSHHPVAHKWAVVGTLMGRAEGFSSSTVNRVEEEKHVVEALQRNGYPKGIIQRQICLRTGRAAQQDSETRATLSSPALVVCQSQQANPHAHLSSVYRSTPLRP